MIDTRQPFDVNTIEDEVEGVIKSAYDLTRTGSRAPSILRRTVDSGDSKGLIPMREDNPTHDPVNYPSHYTSHPSGVECIQIIEHMNFNLGNVIKYIWRAGDKGNLIEDLEKARWYLDREISRIRSR